MAYFETKDGLRLFYRDWGTGKPVVLVHGWCINSDSWEYVQGELPNHSLRCISYDQRGCGRSEQAWTQYDYDTLASDLEALLDTLDLRDVTLAGHSLGSGVITRYLARYGNERIAKAVFVAGTTPLLVKTDDNLDGFDRSVLENSIAFMKRDRAAYIMSLVPSFFGADLPNDRVSQEMIDWAIGLTIQASPQAAVEMLRTCAMTDQRKELKEITTPTLIIHGDNDPGNPLELTAQKTHALMPNSRLIVYEGASHGFYIDMAARLNQDLLAFINSE